MSVFVNRLLACGLIIRASQYFVYPFIIPGFEFLLFLLKVIVETEDKVLVTIGKFVVNIFPFLRPDFEYT